MQRPGTKRVSANRKSLTICHVLLPSRRNLSSSLLRRSFSHPDFQICDPPVDCARIWRSSRVYNGGALLNSAVWMMPSREILHNLQIRESDWLNAFTVNVSYIGNIQDCKLLTPNINSWYQISLLGEVSVRRWYAQMSFSVVWSQASQANSWV